MKIYKNFKIEKKFQNSAIAIGNFDGFHLGHQKVINQGKLIAKKYNLKFGLLVFHPLPIMFFNKKLKNYRIDSLNQKILSSKKYGSDFLIIKKFNEKFSNISSENFDKVNLEIKKLIGKEPFKISSYTGLGLNKLIQYLFTKCKNEND